VIKGSPAAKAGLKRGDVLMKLAGTSLQQPEQLGKVVYQHQGQQVDVAFERNEEPLMLKVQLNGR